MLNYGEHNHGVCVRVLGTPIELGPKCLLKVWFDLGLQMQGLELEFLGHVCTVVVRLQYLDIHLFYYLS